MGKTQRRWKGLPLAAQAKMQLSVERDAVLTCIQEETICSTGKLLHPLAWTVSYSPPSAHQLLARRLSGFPSERDTFPAQFHQMLSISAGITPPQCVWKGCGRWDIPLARCSFILNPPTWGFGVFFQLSFEFCTSLPSARTCFLLPSMSDVQPVPELTVTYLL